MKMKHCRPRCEATTAKGEPCKMTAARGSKLCKYHDPQLAPATHARNREAGRKYWETYRVMKALAALGRA
jgi:hypothetical protein